MAVDNATRARMGALHAELQRSVLNYAHTLDRLNGEDLAQHAWVSLLEAASRREVPETAKGILAYLRRIVLNLHLRDQQRARNRPPLVSLDACCTDRGGSFGETIRDDAPPPDEALILRLDRLDQVQAIRGALADLGRKKPEQMAAVTRHLLNANRSDDPTTSARWRQQARRGFQHLRRHCGVTSAVARK